MTWYNASWPYRKKITIAQSQVDADLTDFPVMVDLADGDILAESRGDMRDVLFTSADGSTKLSHELVKKRFVGIGGWSWFTNPRAIYHAGTYQRTYIGTIDGSGNLYVGQYTHTTGAIVWTLLTATLEVDDHDNPSLIVRPSDSKLVAFYAKHAADTSLRFKVSSNAEDASAWGSESTTTFSGNVTYANPIVLDDDSDACYVFSRINEGATDYRWSYKRTTDFSTWGSEVEFWDTGAVQQYLHCAKNGTGRIDFFASDKHPDNNTGGSSLYHFYAEWDSGSSTLKWYNSAGTEQTLPIDTSKATLVYDGSGGNDGWNHQIAIDGSGYPRVLFQKRVATTGTGDNRLMFSRWNGSAWTTPVEIAALGGYVYSGELSYTGVACFDGSDINTVYMGKQESSIYEIQAWTTSDNGATWSKSRDITSGSATHNLRPFSPLGHPGRMACLWSAGSYTSYTSYTLETFCDPPLATESHVKVPSVSGSTDTDIYVYYGNAAATDQEDAANAWDANFEFVTHLEPKPSSLAVTDSTGAISATKKSLFEPGNNSAKGLLFDGANDYVTLGTALNMAGWTAATIESLVNYDGAGSAGDEHQIFSNWKTGTVNWAGVMLRIEPTAGSNDLEGFAVRQTDTQIGGSFAIDVTPNQVEKVDMVFDSTNLRGYVNGTVGGTTYSTGGAAFDASASQIAYIGNTPHGDGSEDFGGTIYEIRISSVARSAAWLKASSINLRTPSTFYTVGSEETNSSGVTGTGAGTTAATTASGSGEITHKGTGTLSTAVVTASGAGNITHKGTGSLSLAPITASGAGKLTHVGTGYLAIQPVTVDGAGTVSTAGAVTGSGSLTISRVTASGAGTIGHFAEGLLEIGPVSLSGSGVIGHTGTGDLTTTNPSVDGYDSVREQQVRVGVGGYKQGKSKSAKKQKVILIERVEDVEDLFEQIEEVVREEPKVKPLLRKAKKQKPETVENTTDNAQAWIDYYQAIASALQDQEKARLVEEALQRGAEMLNAMMERQETAKLMAVEKRRRDEEDFLLMLMAA